MNKILEHVNNPVNFLKIAKRLLKPNGIIYFEVPDGESALKVSKNCQEFTIEHLTVFAFQSIMSLINKTNLIPLKIERIKEVSGKYTLIAFVKKIKFSLFEILISVMYFLLNLSSDLYPKFAFFIDKP